MINFFYGLWIHWFDGMAYLLLAAFAYYVIYANAVDLNFRLEVPRRENGSIWQDFISRQKGVLKLLDLDFLKIHCPWSKKISTRYRVQEAHEILRYATHKKGWRAEDCHNPANHRQIAKDCFQSRTRFWMEQIFFMLTAPLRIALLLILSLVITIIGLIFYGVWAATSFAVDKVRS